MSKKKKRKKSLKRKKKIDLPKDRNGVPINIGDWLMFDDGALRVLTLTLYEDGGWSIGTMDDDFASDNPGGGIVMEAR